MSKNPFPNDGFQHYYIHDAKGQPLAVIAIGAGTSDGTVVRGISIRSDLDRWERIKGRKLAVGRCRKALNCRCTSDPVQGYRFATDMFLQLHGTEFAVEMQDPVTGGSVQRVPKSAFNVKPTDKESKILECLKKRQAEAAKAEPTPATA